MVFMMLGFGGEGGAEVGAGFLGEFDFDGDVVNVEGFAELADFGFNAREFGGAMSKDSVEGGVVVGAVHAPDVEVVDVLDVGDLGKLFLEVGEVDFVGSFFEEDGEDFAGVGEGFFEDEEGDEDGENGVDEAEAGEAHDDCADEDDDPAEDVFEHVEINGFLVKGVAAVGEVGGEKVDDDADDGEENHVVVVNVGGLEEALDGVSDDEDGADDEDGGGEESAEEGITAIAVGVVFVGGLETFAFEEVGEADAEGVAEIVDGVGGDGDAVCPEAAEEFVNRKA